MIELLVLVVVPLLPFAAMAYVKHQDTALSRRAGTDGAQYRASRPLIPEATPPS